MFCNYFIEKLLNGGGQENSIRFLKKHNSIDCGSAQPQVSRIVLFKNCLKLGILGLVFKLSCRMIYFEFILSFNI